MGNTGATRSAIFSVAAATIFAGSASAQTDDAAAGQLVATQVRQQGYTCAEPASASRDPNADGDAVWILTCNNASYRVRLVPDQAAHIEQLQ